MSRACSSCERPIRKGNGRKALVLDAHGAVARGIVCARCAARGAFLVTPPPTTLPPPCALCKAAPAAVCRGCHDAVAANVRELSAANIALRQACRET